MMVEFFRAHDPDLGTLWDRLLTLQAEVALGSELPALFTDPAWHRARTVIDLGTGNGVFLRGVADRFPDKSYLGIDASGYLIEAARNSTRVGRVEFRRGDILETRGRYDYALLRLVVRHVTNHAGLVGLLERILPEGGVALVFDSDMGGLVFWPELPAVTSLFLRLNDLVNGRAGDALEHFLGLARSSPTLRIVRTRSFTVPSTLGTNLDLMREQYALTVELVRSTTDLDTSEAEAELAAWRIRRDAFSQFGMVQIHIKKNGEPGDSRSNS